MSLRGKRVLVIEDDAILLMSLEDSLAEFGCLVEAVAMSLTAALELARDISVDVAILDVNLNGELVTPVAETLAQRGVPFVFATGYNSHIVPSFANRPRLTKPYSQQQLREAMLCALDRRERKAIVDR